jgi:hypothetical protein
MAVHPDPLEEARACCLKGDLDRATHLLCEYLNTHFFHDEAMFLLSGCFQAKGMHGLSAIVGSAAVDARAAENKRFPEALVNLGAAYKSEHLNETAMRIWLDALDCETIPSQRSKILMNISGLFVNNGTPRTAIDWADKALKEDPTNAGAAANRGMACLEIGRWREGWQGFNATYAAGDRTRRNYRGLPIWDGSPGKRVIVFGDQGVGDEIFFANSLNDMIEYSQFVYLDCHPRLEKLFARSFPKAEVHGTRKHLSELYWLGDCQADAVIGLSDLPMFFRNEDDEWKGAPYIVPAFNPMPDERMWPPSRIGVSWTGGVKKTRTELRSVSLDVLRPIFDALPNAEFYSLQYTDAAARESCRFEEETGIHIAHFPGKVECFDYDVTAEFVASMDLVITVCTTIHHVSGAMGVPCWTLVPHKASWRYSGTGERLPWYDSVRCFRQPRHGDWETPVKRIVEELTA